MTEIREELEKLIPKENIKYNEPMTKHTTFKTGGNADFYIIADNEEQIKNVIKIAKEKEMPLYILGNGSNLLVKDNGVRGIVLKVNIQGIEIKENEDEIIANVKSGNKIIELAQIFKQKEISGFEEFGGIPGTIGGAIRMNAGAHGKEIKDILIETRCLSLDGEEKTLSNEEQKFKYRNSIFEERKYIILGAKFKLKKSSKEEIENKMNQYLIERKKNQPIESPSAGSTFKRGDGFITSKLIDEAGLKGFSIGGAQISEKHAGFIINKGNATSKDILDLIEYTKKVVFEKFKIKIEEEVEIIGE